MKFWKRKFASTKKLWLVRAVKSKGRTLFWPSVFTVSVMTALERDTKRVKENVPSAMRPLERVITTGCIWLSYLFFLNHFHEKFREIELFISRIKISSNWVHEKNVISTKLDKKKISCLFTLITISNSCKQCRVVCVCINFYPHHHGIEERKKKKFFIKSSL